MRASNHTILHRALRRARKSPCRNKVVAVGIDYRNRYIDIATNRHGIRESYDHSYHAEEVILHRSPRSLRRILITRVGNSGNVLPIEPCPRCLKLARKRGVKIEVLSM